MFITGGETFTPLLNHQAVDTASNIHFKGGVFNIDPTLEE